MNFRYPTDPEKLAFGSLFGLLFLAIAFLLAFFPREPWSVQVALCTLGASSGWLAGILASPFSDDEEARFTGLAKGILALGTGFVLAKFDTIIVGGVSLASQRDPDLLVLRICLFFTCFVVGFLFTIVYRMFGFDASERKRRRIAQLERAVRKAERRLADEKD